jgi:hypothetical protein
LVVFQKKLVTKLFIFTVNFFFHFIIFLLSFGPRVHFRGQKLTFWSNHPEYNFQSITVKLSYFTLENFFFFHFKPIFFSFISKLPNVARGHQKNRKRSHFLGTWYLAVLQKKLGTKLFYFHSKKIISLYSFFT